MRLSKKIIAPAALCITTLVFISSVSAQAQPRPITMEQAVGMALENHPLISASEAQSQAARAGVDAAKSAKGLRLTAVGGYLRYDEEPSFSVKNFPGATSIVFGDRSNPAAALSLDYPLYTGGRVEAMVGQAVAGYDAAEAGVALTRDQVAFGARVAFLNVLRAREAVAVHEAALASSREHLRVATEFRDAEVRPKIDVLRAEVQVSEVEDSLEQARNQVALAEAALAQAVGLNPASDAVTVSDAGSDAPAVPDNLQSARNTALAQRRELEQIRASQQAASEGVKAAAAGTKPTIGLNAEFSAERYTTMPETGDWMVAVGVRWPLVDAGETRARVRQARAQESEAAAQLRQTQHGIALEVEQAWLDLESAGRREQTAAVAVAQATESVRLAEEGYASEVYPLTDLLDARAQLTAAKVRHIDSKYGVRIAQERLLLAIGKSSD